MATVQRNGPDCLKGVRRPAAKGLHTQRQEMAGSSGRHLRIVNLMAGALRALHSPPIDGQRAPASVACARHWRDAESVAE